MIENFSSYFLPQQEFFLDKIHYQHKEKLSTVENYALTCTDTITVKKIDNNRLAVFATRNLQFSPDDLFELSVTFCVVLTLADPEKAKQDFDGVDLAVEFSRNGQFALANIFTRLSSLIANITASYGQPPIMTPPVFVQV